MTEPGGAAWRQTTYYPFQFASRYGRGTALQLAVDCPTYDADVAADVPCSTSPASTMPTRAR